MTPGDELASGDTVMQGDAVVPGEVQAVALVATEPLSFWGGYDAATGEIIDRRHPLSGQYAAGRVLVLPGARGSSTGTAVLLEAVRVGQAPAALVTDGRDPFFALAAIVAHLMYGRSFVVVAMDPRQIAAIPDGALVRIAVDGCVSVGSRDVEPDVAATLGSVHRMVHSDRAEPRRP